MFTSSMLKRVVHNPRKRRAAVVMVFGATCVLVVVGYVFDKDRPVEYGAMWLFEQFCGGIQHLLTAADE